MCMVFQSCSWCNGQHLVSQLGLGLGLGTGVFHTFLFFLLLKRQTPLLYLPLAMPLYTLTFMDDMGLSMAYTYFGYFGHIWIVHGSIWQPSKGSRIAIGKHCIRYLRGDHFAIGKHCIRCLRGDHIAIGKHCIRYLRGDQIAIGYH